MALRSAPDSAGELQIRSLGEADVDAADRVMRLAFGTFLGMPEPESAFGDTEFVRSRFAADRSRAFVAELGGEVVGSVFASRWGSYGWFGPLSVRPDLWDRGIAKRLLEPVIDIFTRWDVTLAGLFTFAQSAKHVGLYQSFGFWPQSLTPVMSRAPAAGPPPDTFGSLAAHERDAALAACRGVTGTIFPGLDVSDEIRAADELALGDTVLLRERDTLIGLAVCHCGAGEAGSGFCYAKFGAVAPGPRAAERFERLLDACEALASARGLGHVVAGVNTACHDAYRRLLARGYRTAFQGVIMQRPNAPGFCRPDVYVLDDLR